MLHPATELRRGASPMGYGVFATTRIPVGTITWGLDPLDQLISVADGARFNQRHVAMLEKYSWRIPPGARVLCWDFARFINHGCVPNAVAASTDFDVAVRDIEAGEQLTNDYATLSLERPFACRCGHPVCRGRVHPSDVETLASVYDRQVAEALRAATAVAQPVLPWMRSRAEFDRVTRGGGSSASVLSRQVSVVEPVVAPDGGVS